MWMWRRSVLIIGSRWEFLIEYLAKKKLSRSHPRKLLISTWTLKSLCTYFFLFRSFRQDACNFGQINETHEWFASRILTNILESWTECKCRWMRQAFYRVSYRRLSSPISGNLSSWEKKIDLSHFEIFQINLFERVCIYLLFIIILHLWQIFSQRRGSIWFSDSKLWWKRNCIAIVKHASIRKIRRIILDRVVWLIISLTIQLYYTVDNNKATIA